MTTTPKQHRDKPGVAIRPRREAWAKLRELHGLTSDAALARALGVAETTTYRVLSGAVLPSAMFIGCALSAFRIDFERLFEVTTK